MWLRMTIYLYITTYVWFAMIPSKGYLFVRWLINADEEMFQVMVIALSPTLFPNV